MMESPITVTKNNTLEEHVALMARTTTRREDVSREKTPQITGFSQLPTDAYIITATNMLADLTTALYFIPIQDITTLVPFWRQSGFLVPEPTPPIKELLNGPLFQAAGMFEIDDPEWADKHDEYIAETYL